MGIIKKIKQALFYIHTQAKYGEENKVVLSGCFPTLPNMINESSISHPLGNDMGNYFSTNLFHKPNKVFEFVPNLYLQARYCACDNSISNNCQVVFVWLICCNEPQLYPVLQFHLCPIGL